jgi:hypothetical protein
MRKSLMILLACATATLAGCATDAQVKDVADANKEISKIATISITCPPNGCTIGNLSYTDPRDRHYIAMPTNGADVFNHMVDRTFDLAGTAVPFVAIGSVANAAIKNAGHNVTNTTNTSTVTTASGAGSSTGGSAAYNQIGPDSQNQANPTTTTTDSHNSTTADNHTVDNTATPTVVTQPTPTIVNPVVVVPSTF